MTRVIEIIIAPDGGTKLETKGIAGQACRSASQFLEEALGCRVGEELTTEFHNAETTSSVVDHRQS
jgi:hypothetical protein